MSSVQAIQIDPKDIETRLQTVTAFILKQQIASSGAWPLEAKDDQPNTEATALALLWLVRYGQHMSSTPAGEAFVEEARGHISKGLKFLCDQQRPDKERPDTAGWGDQPGGTIHVLPTAMAVFALARYLLWQVKQIKPLERVHIESAKKGLDWLDIVVRDHWHQRDQRNLAAKNAFWTCIALKEANHVQKILNSDAFTSLERALSVVERASKHGGGWGVTFSDAAALTPSAYLTYLLLKYSPEWDGDVAQKGLEYVRQGYKRLNFTKSHPPVEQTSRSILTLLAGDKDYQSDKIREGIRYLLQPYSGGNAPGSYVKDTYGWHSFPDNPPDLMATHSACRALLEYLQSCTS